MKEARHDCESGPPVLTWKVHLVRQNPRKLILIVPVVFVTLAVCYLFFGSLIVAAAILFLFASSLSDYLFPIIYCVDRRGASARTVLGRTFLEWDRVKKYYISDTGIKLSTLNRPSRLEPYRGVFLRFGENREEVIRAVKGFRDAVGDTAAT